jgi:hypothetical protein
MSIIHQYSCPRMESQVMCTAPDELSLQSVLEKRFQTAKMEELLNVYRDAWIKANFELFNYILLIDSNTKNPILIKVTSTYILNKGNRFGQHSTAGPQSGAGAHFLS